MRATNFDFDPGNFPAQERSTAPFVPQRISFPTGGRFVPAKHRLPGREAGSREGWKNRVQSLSLSRPATLAARPGPAAGPSPAQKHNHDLQKQSPASNRSGRRGNGRQSLLGPVRRGHSQRDGLAVRPCHDRADGRAADRVAGSGPQPDAALRAAIRAADRRGARPAQGNIQPCRVAVRPDRKRLLAQHVRGRAGRLGTRLVVDARRRDTRSVRPVAEAAARKLRRRAAGLSDRARPSWAWPEASRTNTPPLSEDSTIWSSTTTA